MRTRTSSDGLPARLRAFAAREGLLPPGCRVLCAVSGGADSMALLTALCTLAPSLELTVAAAHFDHRLRGAESDRDRAFVTDWCARHEIPLRVGRGDVRAAAAARGRGLEETARALRYDFLARAAADLGCDRIATAHNADDNAETVLLHLVRGTGLDGLTGIPPVRGILIRPLLGVPRIDIEAYLAQENIPHVEDSSNQDTRFARNRVRQEILPVMKDLNPAFISTLAANLVHLREDRELLHDMAESVTCDALVEDGKVSIQAAALADLPHPVAARAVKQLLAKAGRFQVSAVHIDQILALATGEAPSANLNLPEDLFAWRE